MSGPFPVLGVVSSFWSDVLQKRSEAFRNGFREALQKRSIYENSTARSLLLRSPNVFATTKAKRLIAARIEEPYLDGVFL
jgi:hypothetical protein